MKIICRYALKNSKILPRRKIRVEGIIFSLEKSVTGSATAVANRLDGALSDRAYHYVCGEGIVYALAHPTRFAAHSGGTADERYIGAALVLPAAKSDEKNCPYAVYRRSEADIRIRNGGRTRGGSVPTVRARSLRGRSYPDAERGGSARDRGKGRKPRRGL